MEQLPRRTFIQNALGSALAFSLVKSLAQAQALAGKVKPVAFRWLAEVEEMSAALKGGKLSHAAWQQKVEELFGRLALPDLLRSIDYTNLSKAPLFPEDHESALPLEFPQVEGLPEELAFVPMFVAFKKGRAIVPHGHLNMTSMHMLIDGQVHARHYDRREQTDTHLFIEPTLDATFKPGDLSTVSDERNNIHWFKATSNTVFMFNVAVFGIDKSRGFSGREYIDPLGGEKLGNGLIRARRLEGKEAFKLYGNT
ncbi:MAG TPA: hypothetical protein VGB73_10265 [Pyrinomonadaceae bacterium]